MKDAQVFSYSWVSYQASYIVAYFITMGCLPTLEFGPCNRDQPINLRMLARLLGVNAPFRSIWMRTTVTLMNILLVLVLLMLLLGGGGLYLGGPLIGGGGFGLVLLILLVLYFTGGLSRK